MSIFNKFQLVLHNTTLIFVIRAGEARYLPSESCEPTSPCSASASRESLFQLLLLLISSSPSTLGDSTGGWGGHIRNVAGLVLPGGRRQLPLIVFQEMGIMSSECWASLGLSGVPTLSGLSSSHMSRTTATSAMTQFPDLVSVTSSQSSFWNLK